MRFTDFTKMVRCIMPALFASLLLTSCATQNPGEAGMSVAVTLRDVHRCSRISPEITVADAPASTEYFDVRLIQSGEEESFLGGGSWPHDGSGLIPEGGLTRHYRGPCPPAGQSKSYAFVVSAMSKNNMQPLAVRLYHFTQE